MKVLFFALLCVAACSAFVFPRSSHSEAPGTAKIPNADITDLYAFRSYEAGRSNYVVFLMNTIPLQNPNAGPNYYAPSDRHFFELNIDNNGDCVEDIIIQWFNGNSLGGELANITEVDDDPCGNYSLVDKEAHAGILIEVANPGASDNETHLVATALKLVGTITTFQEDDPSLNWREWYQMRIIHGDRQTGVPETITDASDGASEFWKPFDNTGNKGFANYATYSKSTSFIRELDIPGCNPSSGIAGRVFVGQRKESFSIALGKVFDIINFVPVPPGTFPEPYETLGVVDCPEHNELAGKNVLTYALEIHQECVRNVSDVIGVWGTTRELKHVGNSHVAGQQVSRLGNPLVNELVIGLNDKAKFNIGHPSDDSQFAEYVLYPTLPEIIDILFLGAINSFTGLGLETVAPTVPRQDLVIAFLTGVTGLNENGGVCEYQRLNLSIGALAASAQNNMGVIAGDAAGFPNGRRPGDDVVDIALQVFMGRLCVLDSPIGCTSDDAPLGTVNFTDGSPQHATDFDITFPFLTTPNPGAETYTGTSATVCLGASSDGGDGTGNTVGDGCSSAASAIASWFSFF